MVGNRICSDQDSEDLQKCIDNMLVWSNDWDMNFNVKKCKVMHIGLRNPGHSYSMNGLPLETVTSEKDIGITITSNLKPSEHCKIASRTAMNVLFQLLRSFSYRDRKVFVKLYVTYVRPHLEFAAPCWSPWLSKDIKVLERVQEKFIKNVQGLRSNDYQGRLKELGMMTLESRRRYLDLTETFKILKGFSNVTRANYFTLNRDIDWRPTRGNDSEFNIVIDRCRLDVRRYFFTVRVAESWNKLPNNIKELTKLNEFKYHLKDFMLTTC